MQILKNEKLEDGRIYLAGQPEGVCSQMMEVLINNGIIEQARIHGGCGGNTQGVARLMEGMTIEAALNKIAGIDCGGRGTSCPDQMAQLLKAYN